MDAGARADLVVVARPCGETGEGDDMHGVVALESTGVPELPGPSIWLSERQEVMMEANHREMFPDFGVRE